MAWLRGKGEELREKIGRAAESVQQKIRTSDPIGQFERDSQGLGNLDAAGVADVFKRWEEQISENGSVALEELRSSGALLTAIEVLARNPSHRDMIVAHEWLTTCSDETSNGLDILMKLLMRASNGVSSETIATLIVKLCEAHRELDHRCVTKGSNAKQAKRSVQTTIQWVQKLLEAAVVNYMQSDLLQGGAVVRAGKRALDGMPRRPLLDIDISEGSEVWAARPDDGRWCRAIVKSVDTHYLQVQWLPDTCQKQRDMQTSGDGYALCEGNSAVQEEAVAQLAATKVIRVPTGITTAALADTFSEAISIPGEAQLTGAEASAARCHELLSLFAEFRGNCQTLYQCTERQTPALSVQVASALQAMREEREMHAKKLHEQAGQCEHTVEDFHQQVRESATQYSEQMCTIQERKIKLDAQVNTLEIERSRLLDLVRKVETDLQEAKQAVRDLAADEKRLENNMQRVSKEISEKLSSTGSREQLLVNEQHMIHSICAIACPVEEEVAAHASAASAAIEDCQNATGVGLALAAACVVCEHRRFRSLQEILLGSSAQIGSLHDHDNGNISALKGVVHQAIALAGKAHLEIERLVSEFQQFLGDEVSEGALLDEARSLGERYLCLEVQLRKCLSELQAHHDQRLAVVISPLGDDDDELIDAE